MMTETSSQQKLIWSLARSNPSAEVHVDRYYSHSW